MQLLATLPFSVASLRKHGARNGLVGVGLPGSTLNTSFFPCLSSPLYGLSSGAKAQEFSFR